MSASNLEILAYETTPIGLLCLRRRELLSQPGTIVTEITLDHELLMSSHHTASERALANEALAWHPGAAAEEHPGELQGEQLRVLVGGLGLGYTAREVLRSDRVGVVDVVEFLPEVIGFLRDGQVPLSAELLAEPRLRVQEGDVYATLLAPVDDAARDDRWDLVLIDVDHSPDERLGTGSQAFYTESGLLRAKQHLVPGGTLGIWSYAEHSPFADALRATFSVVETLPVTYVNELIDEEHTDWLFLARDDDQD